MTTKYADNDTLEYIKQLEHLVVELRNLLEEAVEYIPINSEGSSSIVNEAKAYIAKCYGQAEKQAKTEIPAIVFYPAGSLGEEVAE